jgi:hypothetical protein
MTCLTIKELKIKIKESTDKHKKILEDINSNRPYSEKKYLQEFNRMIERDIKKSQNCNGKEFFTNYYSSNNVYISGINHTNYIGNSSPSPF